MTKGQKRERERERKAKNQSRRKKKTWLIYLPKLQNGLFTARKQWSKINACLGFSVYTFGLQTWYSFHSCAVWAAGETIQNVALQHALCHFLAMIYWMVCLHVYVSELRPLVFKSIRVNFLGHALAKCFIKKKRKSENVFYIQEKMCWYLNICKIIHIESNQI